MNNLKHTAAAALAGVVAFGSGAAAFDHYRDLREARASAAQAWREIGDIHLARERTAHAALDAAASAPLPAPQLEQARAMLSQVRALPAGPSLLDDPVALDTYKRYQGELTGALFSLAFGAQGSAALDGLRSALPRNEAALAQARQRYRQAAQRHNTIAATLPGSLVSRVTGHGPVPPEL